MDSTLKQTPKQTPPYIVFVMHFIMSNKYSKYACSKQLAPWALAIVKTFCVPVRSTLFFLQCLILSWSELLSVHLRVSGSFRPVRDPLLPSQWHFWSIEVWLMPASSFVAVFPSYFFVLLSAFSALLQHLGLLLIFIF